MWVWPEPFQLCECVCVFFWQQRLQGGGALLKSSERVTRLRPAALPPPPVYARRIQDEEPGRGRGRGRLGVKLGGLFGVFNRSKT